MVLWTGMSNPFVEAEYLIPESIHWQWTASTGPCECLEVMAMLKLLWAYIWIKICSILSSFWLGCDVRCLGYLE